MVYGSHLHKTMLRGEYDAHTMKVRWLPYLAKFLLTSLRPPQPRFSFYFALPSSITAYNKTCQVIIIAHSTSNESYGQSAVGGEAGTAEWRSSLSLHHGERSCERERANSP